MRICKVNIIFITIFIFLSFNGLFAQSDAYFIKQANTYCADTSYWATGTNAASLPFIHTSIVSAAYKNYYSLAELHSSSISGIFHIDKNTPLAISANTYGTDFYNKSSATIATGKQIGSHISLGIAYEQAMITVQEVETVETPWQISIGSIYILNEKLTSGITIKYCQQQIHFYTENIETAFGISYHFNNQFTSSAQINSDENTTIAVSSTYKITKAIVLAAGLSNADENIFIGTSFILKTFSINTAVSSHTYLGNSYHFSLVKVF